LIPDFQGRPELVQQIIAAGPEVISHNLETVERLSSQIRSRAKYHTSLAVLGIIARSGITAKSGIMVGLGETTEEVYRVMDDLLSVGVKVMTIGQYLRPTQEHMSVVAFVKPEQFVAYHKVGIGKGFAVVESSPLVRSSYHAEKHIV
jgi:lipoic acid synthetase